MAIPATLAKFAADNPQAATDITEYVVDMIEHILAKDNGQRAAAAILEKAGWTCTPPAPAPTAKAARRGRK